MNPVTTHIRSCPAGVSRLFILGILLAASVCVVSQDKQQAVNANTGKDEDDIKRLISMYAKAADEADPALASRIWCDSSDDSLINPVGRWHGVEQIMGFYRHEMGEMYSARDLKISRSFRSGVLGCSMGRIQLEFLSPAKKRRIVSLI